MNFITIVYLVIIIVVNCIFGGATQSIIDNKGYDENWFWWGFFFGMIAIVVALSKPDCHYYSKSDPKWMQSTPEPQNELLLKQGGWKCTCGRVNPSYTGTCACGKRKGERLSSRKTHIATNEDNKFDEIKRYKELLDSGIITEEEFNKKKTELLGL